MGNSQHFGSWWAFSQESRLGVPRDQFHLCAGGQLFLVSLRGQYKLVTHVQEEQLRCRHVRQKRKKLGEYCLCAHSEAQAKKRILGQANPTLITVVESSPKPLVLLITRLFLTGKRLSIVTPRVEIQTCLWFLHFSLAYPFPSLRNIKKLPERVLLRLSKESE